ncbi:MAG TPA: hypothetical protein VE978_01585 [Chitinophagales bacterium]|nr:hypothetical protein [Chitinophagales bacterium]
MKKISMIGISFLGMVAVVTVMFFNACTSDPCKDVNCGANGNCVDGTCICDVGYEGTGCTTLSRDKFVSVWNSINNSCIGGQSTGQLTVTAGSTALDMNLSNFGHLICGAGAIIVSATITGETTFEIPTQVVCGTTYSGSGSLNGNQLDISYTFSDPYVGNGSCTDTYN